MDKPEVSAKYFVIQYDGKTYNLPASMNLRNGLGSQPDILARRLEISSELGIRFHNNEGIFGCTDCSHTGIYAAAMKEGVVFSNIPSSMCAYNPDDSVPQWLSYFHKKNKGKKIELVARMNPCVANIGLVKALVEFSKLEEYLVDSQGLQAADFPYLREVESNPETEAKAIAMFQERFKSGSPNLVYRVLNLFR
jgi:hypothetical protein